MNAYIYSMNVIRTYYIHYVVIFTWPTCISCITSLPFINHLLWPHGTLKCSPHAHFRNTPEVVCYPGTFSLHFNEYWEITHFFSCMLYLTYHKVGKYSISDAAMVLTLLCTFTSSSLRANRIPVALFPSAPARTSTGLRKKRKPQDLWALSPPASFTAFSINSVSLFLGLGRSNEHTERQTHTHRHTHTDTHTDTETHTHTQTHIHTYTHTQTQKHTHRHRDTHTDTQKTHTQTQTHTHTHTHTDTHTHRTHTHTDTHTHTHTEHTHTQNTHTHTDTDTQTHTHTH